MTIELIARAKDYGDREAVAAPDGDLTYDGLVAASGRVAAALVDGRRDLAEARVAFAVHPGARYAALEWGVWRAGGKVSEP